MESLKELNGDEALEYLPMDQWVDSKTLCRGIKSIEGLQYAVNLERLDLSENAIKDLTPLKNLKKLNYVELDRNFLGDLTPLSNLTNLTHLNIYNNDQIDDMTAISNLPKLEWLDLHYCNRGKRKVNVEPLGKLTTLKMVNLESNFVEDISFAKNLTNIEIIGVGANHVTDMTPLHDAIHKIYGKGEYVDETKTYVGMLVQALKDPINKELNYETSTFTIDDPVKGLDEYVKAYNITPQVIFKGGCENKNVTLNYNKGTKKIEVTVKGNLEDTERKIDTTIILGYEKYTINIELKITQKATTDPTKKSKEAVKQAEKAIENVISFKDVNENNIEEAKEVLETAKKSIEIAKKLDSTFDKDLSESTKLNVLENSIKATKKEMANKKIPNTIKAVNDAYALKDGLTKEKLSKANGMYSYAEYNLRTVKKLDPEFDKDNELSNKLEELKKAINTVKNNK
ncbi:hypothetical protein GCM10008909_22990 [Hathewaya limosa]